MVDYGAIQQAVIDGDDEQTTALIEEALKQNTDINELVTNGLQTGMSIVGRKFSEGEFFVPEMLFAARAVTRALDILRPKLAEAGNTSIGKMVIGTVSGDIHDIGKNLVSMFLEGAGFEVIDIGTDVSSDGFVNAVREHQPDILGISALLTTTMPAIPSTIKALEKENLRGQVKIVIGGAPVSQHFADQVGADGYCKDGGAAIEFCRKLIGK